MLVVESEGENLRVFTVFPRCSIGSNEIVPQHTCNTRFKEKEEYERTEMIAGDGVLNLPSLLFPLLCVMEMH